VNRWVRWLRKPDVNRFVEFSGNWKDAGEQASGWSGDHILDKVLASSLAVRDGLAVHERDGFLLSKLEHAWPVVAGLMCQAAQDGGELRVLDFGGSLGSSYRQCSVFTSVLPLTLWAVVEQPNYVAAGRSAFATAQLSFHESIDEATKAVRPNAILCSGTLNYIDEPQNVVEQFNSCGADTLILDRVAVHHGDDDFVAVQHVPARFYRASLPLRIFSATRLDELLSQNWFEVAEFPALDGHVQTDTGRAVQWVGKVLRRR
jgi:putative methyltransferase (TIGR04325 family)